MINASHIKVHPHAAGAHGDNQDKGHTKRYSTQRYIWPWMRMVCRSECLYSRYRCGLSQAWRLVGGITVEYLLGDKLYDSNALVEDSQKMETNQSSHREKNEKVLKIMIHIYIVSVISSKILF